MIYRPNLILPDPFDPYPPKQIVSPTRSILRNPRHYWPGKCTCCPDDEQEGWQDVCTVFVVGPPIGKPNTVNLSVSGLIDAECTSCDDQNTSWEDIPFWFPPFSCSGENDSEITECNCTYAPDINLYVGVTFSADTVAQTRSISAGVNPADDGTCFPNCSTSYRKNLAFFFSESAVGPWPASGSETLPQTGTCGCTGGEAVVSWG